MSRTMEDGTPIVSPEYGNTFADLERKYEDGLDRLARENGDLVSENRQRSKDRKVLVKIQNGVTTSNDIAAALALSKATVAESLERLVTDEKIEKAERGGYKVTRWSMPWGA